MLQIIPARNPTRSRPICNKSTAAGDCRQLRELGEKHMGNLKAFLKQNKKAKKTTQFAATKSLCDENGDPLLWTIRPLSTKKSAAIRDECTIEVPVTGKPGLYRQKVNTDELLRKMICAAVVEPDLHNAELQDSYGVMSAEALIVEMVDNPEEFGELATFVQEYSGIDETLQEKVDEAKN